MKKLTKRQYKYFDDIKHIDEYDMEFWYARELAECLSYAKWSNFQKVINRAKIACENSGHDVLYDFAEVGKIVEAGATRKTI